MFFNGFPFAWFGVVTLIIRNGGFYKCSDR